MKLITEEKNQGHGTPWIIPKLKPLLIIIKEVIHRISYRLCKFFSCKSVDFNPTKVKKVSNFGKWLELKKSETQ